MRLLKMACAGLLMTLLAACTAMAPVESVSDRLALADIALTSVANQVKVLKQQGVLVRDSATYADTVLTEANTTMNLAWAAHSTGDEAKALTLLSVAQGLNARLIQYLKQKEKPSGSTGIREWRGDLAGGWPSVRRDADALRDDEGQGRSRGSNDLYRGGAGGDSWRARSGGGSGHCYEAWRRSDGWWRFGRACA